MAETEFALSRRRLLQGIGATWLLSISHLSRAANSQIIAVRIWPSSTYTRVTIESKFPLKYKQFVLNHPQRLVLDLQQIQLNSVLKGVNTLIQNNDPYIANIRISQFNESTVRMVFDLKQPVNEKLFTLAPVAEYRDRLVLDLYPLASSPAGKDDPLLALLEDYNAGDVNKNLPVATTPPKRGVAGKDRPILVMIDPGHGGEDPGAIGKYKTREKDIVLKIARQLHRLIDKEPKMRAVMTRQEDVFIPLGVRVAKARQQKADLFVSIHADAFTSRNARGSSVFALSTKGATSAAARFLAKTQNESDLIGGVSMSGDRYLDHTIFDLMQTATIVDSLKFGKEVLQHMGKINHLHKNKVDQAGFAVLKAPDIPSVLVETAFISNVAEERKLQTPHYQQQVAQALLAAIKSYFLQNQRQ